MIYTFVVTLDNGETRTRSVDAVNTWSAWTMVAGCARQLYSQTKAHVEAIELVGECPKGWDCVEAD